ncbi:MAG TPA: DUF4399 domain-containing protein [Methylibium sp.]|uniref:DUF4399 domain-containing protein n=1 Tax=Methylibium sp. TaxID=2067992 RepID=UPI002DBC265B|nr:DUF4399 domain-containing protein [Methylibium sp.]HEU4457525.1 DUF4399 domain-containing protein [Methylibium sp.]
MSILSLRGLVLGVCLLPPIAVAAPLPADELQRQCWLRYTRERTRVDLREPTMVAFSNIERAHRLRSPFAVDFAVRGMGVAPAGAVLPGTGHHHILIDTPLPIDIGAKIPFSDTHKHFGKGQTGAVLDLPAGRHTLRLLFADHDHRPYFVYSKEVEIEVIGRRSGEPLRIDRQNFDATCRSWYQDELARPRGPAEPLQVLNLRDGEAVTSPFNVRFGVDGFGVCASTLTAERSGHFILDVLQGDRLVKTVDLSNGATQANLVLANGGYQLQLRFVDGKTRRDLLPPALTGIVVQSQERL